MYSLTSADYFHAAYVVFRAVNQDRRFHTLPVAHTRAHTRTDTFIYTHTTFTHTHTHTTTTTTTKSFFPGHFQLALTIAVIRWRAITFAPTTYVGV